MVNAVVLQGRMTKDPELKAVSSGKAVCSFTIAVQDTKEKSFFFRCIAWEKNAEMLNRFFRKGDQILVTGKLSQREWEKGDSKQSSTEIQVSKIDFCGNAGNHNDYSRNDSRNDRRQNSAPAPVFQDISAEDDAELPF